MSTLSRRQHILALAVLAVAGFASMATSAIEWRLDAQTSLPEVPLLSSVLYKIDVEVTGPVQDPVGDLYVDIIANMPGDATTTLRATIDRDGEVIDAEPTTVTLRGGGPLSLNVWVSPWEECDVGPCQASFLLLLERVDDGEPGPFVTVTGEAHISVGEYGEEEAPAGTEVRIEAYRVVP